jgi:hypothetical protein
MTKFSGLLTSEKPVRASVRLLALATLTVALLPTAALAQDLEGLPVRATFAVTAMATPNTSKTTYCGGPVLDTAVEGHGNGFSATIGALTFSLQKAVDSSGPNMHGCLTLTASNGDTLNAVYDGTEGPPNANGFIVNAKGTLTFTGGTGRFKGIMGTAHFTAVFFAGAFPQIAAYYSID